MQTPLAELLAKYNVPGPRYTSYPTVPAWTSDVVSDDYRKSLQTLKPGESLSLYVHLPFCERLCHFCGCMKVITTNHDTSRQYVDVVVQEIERVAGFIDEGARDVAQLHFGGGTPNFLKPEEMRQLMDCIRAHFTLLPDAEIAIEMHPRTSTHAFCDVLQDLGFNRISLGVQDFDPKVQELIHRFQTYEMTEEMLSYLHGLGFESFNFDLIYGLPGQSLTTWQDTLSKVLELEPDRLAVYSYAHVPWVAPVQRSFKDSDLPDPALKLALFEAALSTLRANDYRLIGMDHFARTDDELAQAYEEGTIHRNFMGYSTRKEAHQIGFGVSAISYVGGHYFQNVKELKAYTGLISGGGLATFRGCLLQQDDAIRRELITEIMCRGWLDIENFAARWDLSFDDYFAADLAKLRTFVDDKLLALNKKELKVIGDGFLFLRNMAMAFDPYLKQIQKKAKTPTFSRTV